MNSFYKRGEVFTARYGLIPYIKQIKFCLSKVKHTTVQAMSV